MDFSYPLRAPLKNSRISRSVHGSGDSPPPQDFMNSDFVSKHQALDSSFFSRDRSANFKDPGSSLLQEQLGRELAASLEPSSPLMESPSLAPVNHLLPPESITQKELEDMFTPQPVLPRTDGEFETRYKALKAASWHWAAKHFSKSNPKPNLAFDPNRLSQEKPELVKYINGITFCRPDANPSDQGDFSVSEAVPETFLSTPRANLIFAILGKVLEVHVLGHEMFGASNTQLKALRSLDFEMRSLNGKNMPLYVSPLPSFLYPRL